MEYFLPSLIFVLFSFEEITSEECIETSLTSAPRSFECPGGCCGEIFERYCCSTNGPLSIDVIIAGIAVAAVILVGLIVGIIVYLCKKQNHRRVVVYPDNEVIYSTNGRKATCASNNYTSTYSSGYAQTDTSSAPTYSGPVKPGYGAYHPPPPLA